MSGLEVESLVSAIARGEVARLTKIHGVGKKTAERLVLELREKVKAITVAPGGESGQPRAAVVELPGRADLVSALVNLGYKQAQAEKAAELAAERAGTDAAFEHLFREALKGLRVGA